MTRSACTQAASEEIISANFEIVPDVEASIMLNGTQSGAVLLSGTFDSTTKVNISYHSWCRNGH